MAPSSLSSTRAATSWPAWLRDGQAISIGAVSIGVTLCFYFYPLATLVSVGAAAVALYRQKLTLLYAIVITLCCITFYAPYDLAIRDLSAVARIILLLAVVGAGLNRTDVRAVMGSGISKLVLAYFVVAVVSALLVNSPSELSRRVLFRLASCVFLYFAVVLASFTYGRLTVAVRALIVALLALCIYAFYQVAIQDYGALYNYLHPPDELSLPWSGRAPSFIVHYNGFAGVVNLLWPFALGYALFGTRRGLRIAGGTATALAVPSVVLSQSRGGIAAFGAAIVTAALIVPKSKKRKMLLLGAAAAMIAIAVPAVLIVAPRTGEVDEGALFRLVIYAAAWTLFLLNPILGVGYGNFRSHNESFFGLFNVNMDAHNIILMTLAETGIVGFLAFFALIGAVVICGLRAFRHGDSMSRVLGFAAVTSMVTVVVHGMVDAMFLQSPEYNALFFLIASLTAAAYLNPGVSQTQ